MLKKTLCSIEEARNKRTQIVQFHLYQIFRNGKFIDTESRLVVA